jgi:hypothetical protein
LDHIGNTGNIQNLEYHGNRIGDGKSLVTFDWGNDFVDYIKKSTNVDVEIFLQYDERLGLRGELQEVFICRKI